jgi:hypothetical protein
MNGNEKKTRFVFQVNRNFFRDVSTEEGRALARAWNVPFVEVSAMDLEVKLTFEILLFSIHSFNRL